MNKNPKYITQIGYAFPNLIKQALVGKTICYSVWGERSGAPSRNTHKYMLARIGNLLMELSESEDWRHPRIPALGVIVTRKGGKMPKLESVQDFLEESNCSVEGVLREKNAVFDYKHWEEVLEILRSRGFAPIDNESFPPQKPKHWCRQGGGEKEPHKKLKEDVLKHPEKYGLSCHLENAKILEQKNEHPLPSGDYLDVFFKTKQKIIGVEVKPHTSHYGDIERGLYQCVKYHAVMVAEQKNLHSREKCFKCAFVFLVLGKKLPERLFRVANVLGVRVVRKEKYFWLLAYEPKG